MKISPITRRGQVSSLATAPVPDGNNSVAKIEVEIYEGNTDEEPYLLEFYCYSSNPAPYNYIIDVIEEDDWVEVSYKTLSKKNRISDRTYTVSYVHAIRKITEEKLIQLNS